MAFQIDLCFAASSDVFFHLVVHDQNNGASETTENIREAALEERGNAAFVFHDLAGAVDGSRVQSSRALKFESIDYHCMMMLTSPDCIIIRRLTVSIG